MSTKNADVKVIATRRRQPLAKSSDSTPVPDVETASPSSDTLNTLLVEVRLLRQEVGQLTARMDDVSRVNEDRLRKLEDQDQEIAALRSQTQELRDQLNFQAQLALRNEVEIAGLPESNNENLPHLVSLIASKVGVSLQDVDVDYINRAGPKTSKRPDNIARPVVVKFIRRAKRDEFLKASKVRRNLSAKDLEFRGSDAKMYVNERLTKENRLLFRDARKRAPAAGFKYCWTHNGEILVRSREGCPAIRIRCHLDLDEKFGAIGAAASSPLPEPEHTGIRNSQ